MEVYEIDPIRDPRWPSFLSTHPDASIFHSREWLQSLRQTYAYEPVVYTSSGPAEPYLRNGIPCCRISSRLTGRRLVSLPFSDHCQPLLSEPGELPGILQQLVHTCAQGPWKYLELRTFGSISGAISDPFRPAATSYLHCLDLSPNLDKLFQGFHKSCIQRRIRHAAREHLTHESGRSEKLLAQFYQLQLLMRRKHQLPPQPLSWFRNLIESLGNRITIYVASQHGTPVASVITLTYKHTVTYKYGASDPTRYRLSGIIALIWQAIQAAKSAGAWLFDMGRSDQHQTGLVRFKDRWGASRSRLQYYRYPSHRDPLAPMGWPRRLGGQLLARMPERLITASGNLLYRHMG